MSDQMPDRTMDEEQTSTAVDAGVKRLIDEVVEDALALVQSEDGRSLVTRGVAEVLKDALLEAVTVRGDAAMTTNGQGAFEMGNAMAAATNTIKSVQDLGFVEFTTGLINGTFDAVIASTVKQMDAYSKMVADIAKSLKEFEAEYVSAAEIDAYLLQWYPDPNDASTTVVRPDMTFTTVGDKTGTDRLKTVAEALVRATAGLTEPLKLTDIYKADATTWGATDEAKKATVTTIREKLGLVLAKTSQDALIEMAKMGMARIVVTNGEILSKLTFRVTASELDQTVKQSYASHSKGWGVRGGLSVALGSLTAGGAGYIGSSRFNCNTVNETTFDTATMSAEIIGQVKIGFKTETFAPAQAPARAPATT